MISFMTPTPNEYVKFLIQQISKGTFTVSGSDMVRMVRALEWLSAQNMAETKKAAEKEEFKDGEDRKEGSEVGSKAIESGARSSRKSKKVV
jgi:Arc/MetJ-type ribon-helix-helix transcriptional regulator